MTNEQMNNKQTTGAPSTYLIEVIRRKDGNRVLLDHGWEDSWEAATGRAEDMFTVHFDTDLPFSFKGEVNDLNYKTLEVNIIKMKQKWTEIDEENMPDKLGTYEYEEEEVFVYFKI